MALNKAMKAALKVLSYPDIQLKKHYKLVRVVNQAAHPGYIVPHYRMWNHKIEYDNHDIPIRIFQPEDEAATIHPLIIYFHGGGWVIGNIDSYTQVCARLSQITRHTVVSVDYRLAPEHPFPAAPEDCYYATKEIFKVAEEKFGVKPEDITLMGDSAGGNLAAVVSLMAKDRGEFMPASQVLIYPAVNNDFSDNSPFPSIKENGEDFLLTQKRLCDYMDLYMGYEQDRNNPYFAPLLAKDLSGQPRTLVITAQYDPLRDEGEAYAKRLKEAGNDVTHYRIDDVLHGFFALPLHHEPVKRTYELVRTFVCEKK
jgi:acetyl esterase